MVTRQLNEVIQIDTADGLIEIMVVDIRGPSIRLGITAPKRCPVNRKEIRDAKLREAAK